MQRRNVRFCFVLTLDAVVRLVKSRMSSMRVTEYTYCELNTSANLATNGRAGFIQQRNVGLIQPSYVGFTRATRAFRFPHGLSASIASHNVLQNVRLAPIHIFWMVTSTWNTIKYERVSADTQTRFY